MNDVACEHYWRRLLAFRDQLRKDPAAARHYADVKMKLVESCQGDSRPYTRGKSEIVRSIEREAGVVLTTKDQGSTG